MNIASLVFGLSGLLALVCFMPPLAGRVKLPYSVLLAIVGCVLGYIEHVHDWAPRMVADFLDALESFEISSETFLLVFLPVLLFETALSMNVRRLKQQHWQEHKQKGLGRDFETFQRIQKVGDHARRPIVHVHDIAEHTTDDGQQHGIRKFDPPRQRRHKTHEGQQA